MCKSRNAGKGQGVGVEGGVAGGIVGGKGFWDGNVRRNRVGFAAVGSEWGCCLWV